MEESGRENLWKHFFAEICCQADSIPPSTGVWGWGRYYLLHLSPSERVFQQTTQRTWHLFPAVEAEVWSFTPFWEKLTWPLAGRQGWLLGLAGIPRICQGKKCLSVSRDPNGGHAGERGRANGSQLDCLQSSHLEEWRDFRKRKTRKKW